MGNVLNQITAPAGLKLFPGGPYSDAGLGDKALDATEKAKQEALGVLTGQDWESLMTPEERQGMNAEVAGIDTAAQSALSRIKAQAAERGMPETWVQAMEQQIQRNLMDAQLQAKLGWYGQVQQKRQMMANVITGAGAQTSNTLQNLGAMKQNESAQTKEALWGLGGLGMGNAMVPALMMAGKTGTVGGAAGAGAGAGGTASAGGANPDVYAGAGAGAGAGATSRTGSVGGATTTSGTAGGAFDPKKNMAPYIDFVNALMGLGK